MARKNGNVGTKCDIIPRGKKKNKRCPKGYKINKATGCCISTLADVVNTGLSPSKNEKEIVNIRKKTVLNKAGTIKITAKEKATITRGTELLLGVIASDGKTMNSLVEVANVQDTSIGKQHGIWAKTKTLFRKAKDFVVEIGNKVVSAFQWLLTRPEVWFVVSLALLGLKRFACAMANSSPIVVNVAEGTEVPWFQVLFALAGTIFSSAGAATAIVSFLATIPGASIAIQTIGSTILTSVIGAILSFLKNLISSVLRVMQQHQTTTNISVLGIIVILSIIIFSDCKQTPYVIRAVPIGTKGALTTNVFDKFKSIIQSDIKTAVNNGYLTKDMVQKALKQASVPISDKSKLQKAAAQQWTKTLQQPIQHNNIPQKFLKQQGWW